MLLASEASPQNSAERLRRGREVLARSPYKPVDPKIAKLVMAAVVVVLAAMVVTLASFGQTSTFKASAHVRVDQEQGDQQTNLAGSGEEFLTDPKGLQALPQMMVHATGSRPVAEETIRRLGLEMSPEKLLDNLTVEQVENTRSIVLTYEDTDRVKATQIVNTVGQVFSELISDRSAAGSNLTANVYEEAVVSASPASPSPLRNGLLTLVIGLALVAIVAIATRRTT